MTEPAWIRLDAGDAAWPAGWRDLDDAPDAVLVTGRPEVLAQPALAIVGTRRATPRGLAVARRLAGELAAGGWTIASGLALGIDGEAHRGALETGGTTVAVMATGPDRTYPTQHRQLRERIEQAGCAVTETPAGGGAGGRWLFPRRNRLIAALASGVIVVEAPRQSGALVTAHLAADLGRTVWAVPGPVDAPESEGCHDLLRDGALLCAGAADIAPVLPPPLGVAALPPRAVPVAGSAARWILDRLDLDGVDQADLLDRWPGTAAMWHEGLLALELAGLIRRLPGGRLAPRIWHS
ncbi:MAG TPA: DNA-processing protein DprA [Candidatus Krumholzibacteria bacterium]|nr:DNA-processing protein DprA [Candidatus Krumholzibacteria bacterium]HPD71474.1 DNA-processing protein DprA [Candidatus Krumholzibacteria bacterium]HRY41593.1 DNA-processing protein DprA [Candidatus Krumholzibacteria bacterium]